MAVSITELVGLDSHPIYPYSIPLVSVYSINGVSVDFDKETATDFSLKIVVDGITFDCVQVSNVGNVYRYMLSVDFLRYLITLPTDDYTVSQLKRTITYNYIGYYDYSNITTSSKSITLCFATPVLGGLLQLRSLYTQGATNYIYHNGRYMTYDDATNNYVIHDPVTTSVLGITYVPPVTGGYVLSWLNLDGCFSFWSFKIETEEYEVKNSNEISNFYLKDYDAIIPSENLSQTVKRVVHLGTVAYNTDHHWQLCQIIRSKRVFFGGGYAFNVKECTKVTLGERQNLSFKITLEREDNAAGY